MLPERGASEPEREPVGERVKSSAKAGSSFQISKRMLAILGSVPGFVKHALGSAFACV